MGQQNWCGGPTNSDIRPKKFTIGLSNSDIGPTNSDTGPTHPDTGPTHPDIGRINLVSGKLFQIFDEL